MRRYVAALLSVLLGLVGSFVQLTPASAVTGDTSQIDYALNLNGSTDYLQATEGTAFVSRAVYSVEVWAKPNAGNCSSVVAVTCSISSHDGDWWIGVQNGVYKYLVYYAGQGINTGYISTGVPAVANSWSHLALVRNDTTISFYVDDQLASTTTVTTGRSTYSGYPINVGWHYGNYFAGQVDELKLWGVARTSAEILTDMHAYQTSASTTANLISYWDFNEGGANTTVNNRVGTANTNLTFTNASPVPDFVDVKTTTKVNGKTVVTFPRSYLTPFGGWVVPATYGRAEALAVAGGGGGGSRHAGGGGAGELQYQANFAPTAGATIAIKVGQGGRGMTASTTNAAMSGQPGQNTTLSTATALGGGAGAGGTSGATSGGSGGGLAGAGTPAAAGAGTGLKNAGGVGSFSGAVYGGGGGGGAGGAGANAAIVNSTFKAGDGGAGYQSSITGTALCYASGGGAGAMSANVGVGGACSTAPTRAGSGSYNSTAGSASANSGSGGGAGGFDGTTNQAAGSGGSGVIVIAYAAIDDKSLGITSASNYASTTAQIFPTSTTQDFTLEVWVKPTSIPANHQPIITSDATLATRFYLGTYNTSGTTTTSQVHVGIGNSNFTSVRSIRASEWTHIAVTVSGTTVSLYINGYFDSSATMTRVVQSSGLWAGYSTNTGTTQFFNGQLDQIKVWNSALSAANVSRSMHAYVDSDASQIDTTLQHAWDFNIESSSAYEDYNGSVKLTKTGAPTLTSTVTTSQALPNARVVFERTFLSAWGGWVSQVIGNNSYLGTVLVVAGGGGAGKAVSRVANPAGSGGGGGVSTSSQTLTAGNVFAVKVGVGGPGATAIADDASTRNGQSSIFNATTVLGGGGGGSYGFAGAGGAVATGGGGGGNSTANSCTSYGYSGGVANSGLNGSRGVWGWGGAGAGAGASATDGNCVSNNGAPGAGVTSSLTGSNVEYGRGGYNYLAAPTTVDAGTGTGGATQYGAATGDGTGIDGASGKVVLSYRISWIMSYDPNGGTGTQPDSYWMFPNGCQNLTASTSVVLARPGYNFAGWRNGATAIGLTGVCTQPSGDRVWLAQWSDAPVVNLDAASTTSLPATGATWTSIATMAPGITGITSTAISGQTYVAGPPNSLTLPDSAYVNMGANNAANISGAITVEVWAKCSALRSGAANNILASKWFSTPAGAAASGNDWQFGIYGDHLNLSTTNSTNKAGTSTISSTSCAGWNNYAFTLDPSNNNTLTFYINGVADGSYTGVTHTAFTNTILQIGDGRTGEGFQGNFSKFRLYNLVLSGAQMAAKYAADTAYFAETYTTTYAYNSADGGTRPVSNTYTPGGTAITLPTPTRTGFTFGGWYADAGFTTSVGAAGASYTPNSSGTIYAKWNGNSLTVTYNSNGGSAVANGSTASGGTMASAPTDPTKTGYIFAGWYTDAGLTTQAVFPNYVHGQIASFTLYAKWTAGTYTLTYSYNGATGGAGVASASYITGGAGITLPSPTRTGYSFAGWFAESGFVNVVSGVQTPSADATLYAKWTLSTYIVDLSPNYGIQANSVTTVPIGNTITLPTLTRTSFVFDGWYTAPTGGTKVGNGGASYTPTADTILHARWIQSSLVGVIGSLSRVSTITASNLVDSGYIGSSNGTGITVMVPHGSLPAGTLVNLDLITDNTYAQSLIAGVNTYVLSLAVSWLAPDDTVPSTNNGTSISLTITNSAIRAGSLIYGVQDGVSTLLGTATANGTATVLLTSDPSIYIVQRAPGAPLTVSSTFTDNTGTITWATPASDGGALITGYRVTLDNGDSCVTTSLTCTFVNLTSSTAYTATVVATNSVGTGQSASASFTTSAPAVQPPAPTPTPPVTPVDPKPPVTPVDPTPKPEPEVPTVPAQPVVVKVPTIRAVEKVLKFNVPVLNGAVFSAPIRFAANSAKLNSQAIALLKVAAQKLASSSGWLLITGFVKYTGSSTPAMRALAGARAKVTAQTLALLGVKVKIGYLGYGPQNTKAPKDTDRKVELRWLADAASK